MKVTHGHSHRRKRTREYRAWDAMIQRCQSPNCGDYSAYGGRGIRICEQWQSFDNFLADMGECPKGHTLEREKNNGNYEPTNCRWTTRKEQARNRRSSKFLSHNGETLTQAEWAERVGISQSTLHYRLKRGWSMERALTEVV